MKNAYKIKVRTPHGRWRHKHRWDDIITETECESAHWIQQEHDRV